MPRPAARPSFAARLGSLLAGAAAGLAGVTAVAPAASAQIYYGTPVGGGASYPAGVQVASTRDDGWAKALFSQPAHDFGVVARGALTEHPITLKNTTGQTLHVSGVSASCSCASGELSATTLAPGESATLTLAMNTRQFYGKKDSNVIVRFDAPRYAEVRIPVKMYCRKDVVLTPGEVNFGAVDKGAGADRTVEIAYAGSPNWQIKAVEGAGEHLTAKVEETSRNAAGARYVLRVRLSPDAPPGPVRERLALVTSDQNNPKVPVLVEGVVEDDITVRDVDLGTLAGGQKKQFNVVLRGKKPFKILAMACDGDGGDQFGMKLPDTTRPVHVVRMEFTAPDRTGAYAETFVVDVEGRDDPVMFQAKGRVLGR